MQEIKKIAGKTKIWFTDHLHLLFKSAADNHLRIQQILQNSDGSYQLTVKFNSYSELKTYQKKIRRLTVSLSSAVAMVIVAFIVAPLIMNPNRSSAASYFWNQTSWDSAASSSATIAKPGPGTTFQSMDSNLQIVGAAPADSSISLKELTASKSQTNNGDLDDGFNKTGMDLDSGNVTIPSAVTGGQGTDGNVQLAQSSAGNLTQTDNTANTPSIATPSGGWDNRGSAAFNNVAQNGTLGDGASLNLTQVGGSVTPMVLTLGTLPGSSVLALKSDGSVWRWGGNGTNFGGQGSKVPVNISNLSNIVKIFSNIAEQSFCALDSNGGLWCWGNNSNGVVGNGSTSNVDVSNAFLVNNANRQIPAVTDVVFSRNDEVACLIDVNQEVWCWGNKNSYGVQGNGTITANLNPTKIVNFSGVKKLSIYSGSSSQHACALKNDGTVWCWGNGSSGQMGNGTAAWSYNPTLSHAGADNVDVIANGSNTLVLKSNGNVFAWGDTSGGATGTGLSGILKEPTQTTGLSGISKLYAGPGSILTGTYYAIRESDGTVWSWGSDSNGVLGNDSAQAAVTVPVQVAGLSNVSMLKADNYYDVIFALTGNGDIFGWGYNYNGETGNGTMANPQAIPSQVKGLNNLGYISGIGALYGSCASSTNGTLYCWGNNTNGSLGNNSTVHSSYPVNVISATGILTNAQSVSRGDYSTFHTCATETNGNLYCWGYNGNGQIGRGNLVTSYILPLKVLDASGSEFFTNASKVDAGVSHTCASKTDGSVWCWGDNTYGQLGDGTSTQRTLPVQVKDTNDASGYLTGITQISLGQYYSCALKNDSSVYCWGRNNYGQLGINSTDTFAHTLAVKVKNAAGTGTLSEAVKISAGNETICTLQSDKTAYCWGNSAYGQIGYASTISKYLPTTVRAVGGSSGSSLINLVDISAGYRHTCAVNESGNAYCWGQNGFYQVGDNTITARTSPVQVKDSAGTEYLSGISKIDANASFSCAMKSDGSGMYCWGYNYYGQIGNNSTTTAQLPVPVLGSGGLGNLSGISQIALSYGSTCSIMQDGTMRCWGYNLQGQLGIGTSGSGTDVYYPTTVLNPANNVLFALSGGYSGSGSYTSYLDGGGQTAWKQFKYSKHGSLNGVGTTNINVRVKSSSSNSAPPSDIDTSGCSFSSLSSEGEIINTISSCAGTDQYLWYKATLVASMDLSESPVLDYVTATSDTSFRQNGNYTSAIIDTGQKNSSWGNLVVNALDFANPQSLNIKVRSCSTSNCLTETISKPFSGCTAIPITQAATTVALTPASTNNCVTSGDRYVQYQGVFAGNSTGTAKLNDITLNYNYYPNTLQKFISSPFDTAENYNSIADLKWTKSGSGTLKFQVRAADSQANLANAQWCGPAGGCNTTPGASNDYYVTDAGNTINSSYADSSSNRWVQYAAFMASDEGDQSPSLNDVTLTYAFNTPPQVSIQGTIAQDANGTVPVTYKAYEVDADKDVNNGNQQSAYVSLVYQPDDTKKILLNNSINDTATSITLYNSDPTNIPLPTSGTNTILIDNELISYTGVTNPTSTTPILTGVTRHINFGSNASFPTQAASHSGKVEVPASPAEVWLLGKNVGMVDSSSNLDKTTTWTPKTDSPSIDNGKKFASLALKVVATDGSTYSSIGNANQNFILDLEKPTVSSIVADFASISEPEKSSGLFGIGKTIPVKVTFFEPVTTTGDVIVKLDMGNSRVTNCIINISGAAVDNKACNITINEGDLVNDLSLIASAPIVGTIKDQYSNASVDPAAPAKTDLHDSPDVKVDGVKPTVTSVTETSNNANTKKAKPGDKVTLSISADETLSATPTVTIGGHSATVTGSSSPYIAEYTYASSNNTDTEGDTTFTISLTDGAGNVSNEFNQANSNINGGTVVFDRTKPTLSNISAVSNNTDNQKAKSGDVISLTFTSNEILQVPTVKIGRDESSVLRTANSVTNVGNIYTATYTMQDIDKEENIPYSIEFTDEAGNIGDTSTGDSGIIFDRTKPTASEVTRVITPTNDSTPDYTFATNEAGTIQYGGVCSSLTTDATIGDNTITFETLTDGTYGCSLTVTDATGNASSALNISGFEIDTHGTNITLNSPQSGSYINAYATGSFSFNEALQSGDIIFTATTANGGETAETQHICHLNPALLTQGDHNNVALDTNTCQDVPMLVNNNTYTVTISGVDLAGNTMNQAQLTNITFDTVAPSLNLTIPAFFNNYGDQSDISYSVFHQAEDADTGLDSATLTFTATGGNAAPDQTCHLTNAQDRTSGDHSNINLETQCQENITLVSGTIYTVALDADDNAHNAARAIQTNVAFDNSLPTLELFTSTTNNTCGASACGTGAEINITATMSEPIISGNMIVRLANTANPAIDVELDQISGNQISGSYIVDGPNKGHDTNDLAIASIQSSTVADRAENVQIDLNIPGGQNLSDNKDIVIDTGPPVLDSFTAPAGNYNEGDNVIITADYSETLNGESFIDITLSSGKTLTLSSISGDKLTGTYAVGTGENAESLTVAQINSQNAVDLIGNPLQTTDIPAQNISGVQIDTTAPGLGSPAISYLVAKTNNQTPNATLSANDNFDINDGTMKFSLNGGTSWCAAANYASQYGFDITNSSCGGSSTNEVKTVTVKFIDIAGNESSVATAQIEYDNSKPVLQSISVDKDSGIYGPDSQIKITAQYNEVLSNGSLVIALNNGKQITLSTVENLNMLTGTYTVGSTGSLEDTDKLKVASIQSQSVSDTSDPTNTQDSTSLSGINENIDTSKIIVIDTLAPNVSEPDGKFLLDRSSEENKIKITIKPYDDGLNLTNIHAEIKLLDTNSACSYTGAQSEILSGEATFSYGDNQSSIKKVCLRLTDNAGNISEDYIVVTPNTPENFNYMDLTNEAVTGTILTWSKPTEEGTGTFSKYDLISCESNDSNACIPDQSHEITSKDQNYFVITEGLSKTKNYCYKVVFKDLNGNISKNSPTICGVPGQGPVLSNTDVAFKEAPFTGNITETSAKVIFETINKNDSDAPLATTAKVEVFTTQDLTGEALKTIEDGLAVIHSIDITGLEQSKKYYLNITATDSTSKSKTVSYGSTLTADTDPTLTFTTAGVLASIDAIAESVITDSKAVITFTTNENAKCFIDFKESTVETYNDLSDNIEKDFAKNHSITLTQLLAKTAYDYKITCSDKSNVIITSSEKQFATLEKGLTQGDVDAASDNNAPEISNISLASITGENATVTWSTNEAANSMVLYEADGTDFMMVAGDANVLTDINKYSSSHTVSIKNLIPASKYSFSVVSHDTSGNIGQSTLSTFTTKEPSSLSSIKVLSKALGQATITWETGTTTSSTIEYGLTTSYGQKKEDSSKVKEHTITLSDLTPGETYHFRVRGEDDQKNIFASSDITFQPKAPPKISDFKVDSITEHGATVAFNTNVPTDSLIIYGDTKDNSNSGFQGRPEVATKHEVKLNNLSSGTEFSIKLKVRDEDGNETEETFPNFTTTKDEVPPKIDRVKTDSALTQTDKVQAIISWSTDELSTGEIIYKEGKSGSEKKFEVNSAPSFSHIGVITSFKSGLVYYFKVVSQDQAGNTITSTDYALLTPKQRQNIIQIIIGNFTDIFGWAKF